MRWRCHNILAGLLLSFGVWANATPVPIEIVPQVGHSGRGLVTSRGLAFSADGSVLLTASNYSNYEAKLWDIATGRLIRTFSTEGNLVSSAALSPDKKYIALSVAKTVTLWDTQSGEALRSYAVNDNRTQVAFGDNGRVVVTAGNSAVKIWDTESGKLLRDYPMTPSLPPGFDAVVSANGAKVVWLNGNEAEGEKNKLVVVDTATGAASRVVSADLSNEIVVSPDGSRLVTWDVFGTGRVVLWDASGVKLRDIAASHKDFYVVFSPDGKMFLTLDAQKSVLNRWDAATGTYKDSIAYHGPGVPHVISPDGRKLVATGLYGRMTLYSLEDDAAIRSFPIRAHRVRKVSFSDDGRRFAAMFYGADALWKRTVQIWDAVTGTLMGIYPAPDFTRWQRALNPQTGWLEDWSIILPPAPTDDKPAGTRDDQLPKMRETIWRPGAAEPTLEIDLSDDDVYAVHGNLVLVGGKRLVLWDGDKTAQVRVFDGAIGTTVALAFSGDGKYALSSGVRNNPGAPDGGGDDLTAAKSKNGVLQLWDVAAGKPLGDFGGFRERVGAMLFLDGRVATESQSSGLRIWDLKSGRVLYEDRSKACRVESVKPLISTCGRLTLSPDGKRLLWQGRGTVELVDVAPDDATHTIVAMLGKKVLGPLSGTITVEVGTEFSADGRRFVLAYKRLAEVRNAQTGALISTLRGHSRENIAVAISPDGKRVVTGCSDGTARMWDADSGAELVRFISSPEGEWLAMTVGTPTGSIKGPTGFFNASPAGGDLLAVVRGYEVHTVDQVYEKLYRPQLVAQALQGDTLGSYAAEAKALNLASVLDSGDPPAVNLLDKQTTVSPDGSQITVKLQLVDAGHGIGRRLVVSLDGHTQGDTYLPDSITQGSDVVLERTLPVSDPSVPHTVKVVAYNAANLLASPPLTFEVGAFGAAEKLPPRMYALAVGINNYTMPDWKLGYASSDAAHFIDAMRDVSRGAFSEYKPLLINNDNTKIITADTIAAAFEAVANDSKLRPNDLFVLFMAGHGSFDGERYHFIPQDFDTAKGDTIAANSIDNDKLQALIASIKVDKRVVILDTCASGKATIGRGLDNPLQVAAFMLNKATGDGVIAASSDIAHEHSRLGYGLLTYGVLKSLEPADASDATHTVSLGTVADRARQDVYDFSNSVFGEPQKVELQISTEAAKIPLGFKRYKMVASVEVETQPGDYYLDTVVDAHEPDIGSAVMAQLPKSKRVKLIRYDPAHKWAKILWDHNNVGWVPADAVLKLID
jgi:WD40 repeat protein